MEQSTADSDVACAVSDSKSLSELVIEAVADAEGVDPIDISPLYDAIDPDALDALFSSSLGSGPDSRRGGEVRFTYHGYSVRVTANGQVTLCDVDTR